ncbi:uncharacterized protein RHIMIDRAFT_197349, partial [Rhizopus microsporus ATCC 52813]
KSYDRVHPVYLRYTLEFFGFPQTLINILCALFFQNQTRVNINGHFTAIITQERGLR